MSDDNTVNPDYVANFLLTDCRERGDVLTNLKLQKLLFYSQAWYLALKNKPLFSEDFQAWVHGPVLPSQYQRFKKNQWKPILDEIPSDSIASDEIKDFLKEIISVFGVETATELELMTHNERPWIDARGGIPYDQNSESIITKDSMRDYYRSMISV